MLDDVKRARDLIAGKLIETPVLSLKEDGFVQMEADEHVVYDALIKNDGFLPLNDKSDKEVINKTLHLSKRAFKRSVGRLMKSRTIVHRGAGPFSGPL